MRTDAQRRAQNKYKAKSYDQINYRVPKEERLKQRINIASRLTGVSSAQYVLDAVRAKLESDGVTLESLPPEEATSEAE